MKRNIVIALLSILLTISGLNALHAQRLPADKRPADLPYKRDDEKVRPSINYDYIREADVMWRKRIWRVVDVREKLNLPFALPNHTLIEIMLDGINKGEIKAYSAENDSFTFDLKEDALKQAIGATIDTVDVPQPDGTTKRQAVPKPFDPRSVKRYRIKEDWVFDKELSTMVVRIMGICPVKDDVNDQGDVRGEKPMFWIYYPECRAYLAKNSSFNEQNDAIHMSWEDLFEQRKFSSYVIKEDNVYDRRIKEYATGIDALLESDKIKNSIFTWEHDVWSF